MLAPTSVDLLDERRIGRALSSETREGVAFQRFVSAGRRTLAVNAVRSPAPGVTAERFDEAVARRAAASGHRLLPVVASGHFDGCHWVAYEVGGAVSLAAAGARHLSAGACLDLLSDVALVLDEATAEGLLTWELGPASILLDHRFGALVSDFGTAREALGQAGAAGRDAFAAPEVRRGKGAGERSGVFVCGALMHRLLGGAAPGAVVARATAAEPLDRYPTCEELCRSARRALSEQAAGGPSAARGGASRTAAAPRRVARRPRSLRRIRRLAPAGVLIGLVTGFAIGLLSGGGEPAGAPAQQHAAGRGMEVTLPPGWSSASAGPSGLAAYPAVDGFSSLTVALEQGLPEVGHDDPVRLGGIDVWRDTSDFPAAVRYAAPTDGGSLVITCEASPGAVPGTLRECEQAASTLDLGAVRVLPLPGVVEDPQVWAATRRLTADHVAGRRRLARARRPSGQRAVAAALARAHARAARELSALGRAEAVAAAAEEAADAYRALARAAGRSSARRWDAAREAVRRSDAALDGAIAAHSPGAP